MLSPAFHKECYIFSPHPRSHTNVIQTIPLLIFLLISSLLSHSYKDICFVIANYDYMVITHSWIILIRCCLSAVASGLIKHMLTYFMSFKLGPLRLLIPCEGRKQILYLACCTRTSIARKERGTRATQRSARQFI